MALSLITITTLAIVLVSRDHDRVDPVAATATVPTSAPARPSYPNISTTTNSSITDTTSLAALAWAAVSYTMQNRVYYQDSNDCIRESAWKST